MIVSRYIGGKEISQTDLSSITITSNHEIRATIDRVVSRINSDADAQIFSTKVIPAYKNVATPKRI